MWQRTAAHANRATIQPQFTGILSKMLSGNAAKKKQRQSIVFPGLQQWEEGRIACIGNAVKIPLNCCAWSKEK